MGGWGEVHNINKYANKKYKKNDAPSPKQLRHALTKVYVAFLRKLDDSADSGVYNYSFGCFKYVKCLGQRQT